MDEVIQKTRNFVAKYQERVFKVLSIKQMKRMILAMMAIISCLSISAADSYTVTITYDGSSATVSIPSAISSYVSCSSGSSSHVRLIQKSTATSNPGEIIYQLSGSSSDGEFYMEGEFKATLLLKYCDLLTKGCYEFVFCLDLVAQRCDCFILGGKCSIHKA